MEEHPTFHEGEPAARIAAVKIAFDDVVDDWAEEAVFLLEPSLVLRQEPAEMME